MKKYLILAASAVLVLAACAKVETIKNDVPEAINFGVYAGNAATKAVSATDYNSLTTALLQSSTNGFGVFAYYTDAKTYAEAATAGTNKPNFMYNQQVTYSSPKWTYSPVKYWPNEHGASAVSTDTDKLTFLAYAPYVANFQIGTDKGVSIKDNQATAAAATEGIIAMTANDAAGDATLTFKVPASGDNQIDLLYGVMAETYQDVENATIGAVGGPLQNLTKQKTNGQIKILFKHALAKVAIDIKEVVNAAAPTTSVNPASDGTKVVVKSVKLKGTTIGTQGSLNLYTHAWSNLTTATEFTVSPLPAAISVADAPTAFPTIAGVDEDGLDKTIDFMLIPSTTTPATTITGVEIVYYVCTEDTQLAGGVSVVENKISKNFATAVTLEQGKQYNLNILLGLTSIDLTATVDDWTVQSTTNVDLPKNVQ